MAQSQSSRDLCLRFRPCVTAPPARLDTSLSATTLAGRDFHPLVCISFSWRTLRVPPPLCCASVLSASRLSACTFSLSIATTGSHVPYKSLIHVGAAYIPDAVRTENRASSELVPRGIYALGFDIVYPFRYVISGSLALVSMYLTCRDQVSTFPSTLTTGTLYPSRLRWFETGSYHQISRGRPSSFVEHGSFDPS